MSRIVNLRSIVQLMSRTLEKRLQNGAEVSSVQWLTRPPTLKSNCYGLQQPEPLVPLSPTLSFFSSPNSQRDPIIASLRSEKAIIRSIILLCIDESSQSSQFGHRNKSGHHSVPRPGAASTCIVHKNNTHYVWFKQIHYCNNENLAFRVVIVNSTITHPPLVVIRVTGPGMAVHVSPQLQVPCLA